MTISDNRTSSQRDKHHLRKDPHSLNPSPNLRTAIRAHVLDQSLMIFLFMCRVVRLKCLLRGLLRE